MERATCRYSGVEIDVPSGDLPEGVVRIDGSIAHESCAFAGSSDPAAEETARVLEREFQQARARGPVSGA